MVFIGKILASTVNYKYLVFDAYVVKCSKMCNKDAQNWIFTNKKIAK